MAALPLETTWPMTAFRQNYRLPTNSAPRHRPPHSRQMGPPEEN